MNYPLIQLIFTAVSVLIIGFWQFHQIKTLKTQISSYQDILNSMKSYVSIFNMDEVQKQIHLRVENKELELKNTILKHMDQDELFSLYYEMVALNLAFLSILPERKEDFINTHVKLRKNKEILQEFPKLIKNKASK